MESEASLAQVIKDGTPEQRDHVGQLYARFRVAGPTRTGLLHADPHPGNFRILADGRLGVVDYGAVARLPDGFPRPLGELLSSAMHDDWEAVVAGLREQGFLLAKVEFAPDDLQDYLGRSEEHTSELQSLMRISYAVFCLKKKIIHDK